MHRWLKHFRASNACLLLNPFGEESSGSFSWGAQLPMVKPVKQSTAGECAL